MRTITMQVNATITITVEDSTDQQQPTEAPAAPAATFAPPVPAFTAPASTGRLVVIPCGSEKLDHPAPAGEMYTSRYHASFRRAADCLTADGGTILILSAKHGFLPLDKVIKPYDMEMGDSGSVTARRLTKQANELGVADATEVTLLLPKAYVEAVAHIWPQAAEAAPLKGKRIGEQRSLLKQMATA